MKTALVLLLALTASFAQAQMPPIGAGQVPNMSGGSGAPGSVGDAPPVPGMGGGQENRPNDEQASFIYGKVAMADGSPVPNHLAIERMCFSSRRTVAYTDTKGQFSYQNGVGAMPVMAAGETVDDGIPNLAGRSAIDRIQRGNDGATVGCSLYVELAGYHADPVSLDRLNGFGGQNAGTLVLHRLGGVEGTAISATLYNAPAPARKAYANGMQAMQKNKLPEAQKELEKALEIDPKLANAWLALGRTQMRLSQVEPARASFLKAIQADSRLVEAEVELGLILFSDRKWPDAAVHLDAALKLDSVDFPQIWFTDAVANFYSGNYERAEKSAREALKLDPSHKNPYANQILGMALAQRKDYSGAAEELRTFIKLAPPNADLTAVRDDLARLEGLARGAQ